MDGDSPGCPPGALYEIRIRGTLHKRWLDWFDGFTLLPNPDGETVLSGRVADTSALYGVLDRLRDLNLELVQVRKIEE